MLVSLVNDLDNFDGIVQVPTWETSTPLLGGSCPQKTTNLRDRNMSG